MAGNIPTGNTFKATGAMNTKFAFIAMTTLFFIWGFITALNDILIPHLKAAFDLNYTEAMLVQFCFFGAYFIISPFAGKLIEKVGYQRGIIIGLLTIAAGCLLFYPAAEVEIYAIFLLGLFILASGVTILQVSANPYVAILGSETTAASRLNLAQAINSLGHTLGPAFGAALIFGGTATIIAATAVQLPYLILASVMIITAVIFSRIQLPVITDVETTDTTEAPNDSVFKHPPLLFGTLAIFLYVGAEVSIGSFLVNFFAESHIGGLSEHEASKMVSYYWGAAMIGRFIGAALMRIIRPSFLLAFNAMMVILLITLTVNSSGQTAMWAILSVGFFNSIMFPTIFTLAIKGLGPLTGRGSGLLCQAIVGGAVIPMLQGVAADVTSVQASFIVPAFAYVYIAWYALKGSKSTNINNAAEVKA
ncbi:sugar MFS transporter [Thalassotalea sp. PP2-459]|uniref:sugar MFS transporter n=1 Tax=Thalassotalea sp. PP2-459 TaxID=1742724 RepID=UPI000945B7C3|nr:sugar MFS transporter [Thalassotalea sp. PP2-459]OKY26555.1 glucose/galactose MFS transporter [Thalassotalea sp. PP2-459]